MGHLASSVCSITYPSICLLLLTVSRALTFISIILSFCSLSLCIYLFICHLTSYSSISKIVFIQLLFKVLQEKTTTSMKNLLSSSSEFSNCTCLVFTMLNDLYVLKDFYNLLSLNMALLSRRV